MGMHTKAILDLIERRPGVRTVEIADLVDCELDMVETSIKDELAAGTVLREQIIAPNGRPTFAYRMRDARPAQAAVEPEVAPKPEPLPRVDPPAPPAPPAPSASPAPLVSTPTKTKVEIAMDFVRGQPDQTATDDELRGAMNLRRDQHPASFLSTQMKRGYLIKRDGRWHLREGKQDVPEPQALPPALERPASAEFRCALWSDGELQLARGDQTAMRLTAIEVGRLREYLAGSRAVA